MQMTNTYSEGFAYIECLSSYYEADLADSFFPLRRRTGLFFSLLLPGRRNHLRNE